MNRLEELIGELCPDGVEYKSVGDISTTLVPTIKVKSNDYLLTGKYPIIDQGQDYIGGYTNYEGAFPKGEYIIFGDHTCIIKYVDFSFVQGADGVKVIVANLGILPKYLYYAMSNIKMDAGYKRHWSKMKCEQIPVPPLEVQNEIVRILDNFTELTAKLTAELKARKQQYEYYRDYLFNYGLKVHREKIGNLTKVFSAARVHKGQWTKEGVPFYRSSDVISKFNGIPNPRGDAYISYELYKQLSAKSGQIKKGDILVTGGGTIGIPYIVPSDDPLYIKDADLICIQKCDKVDSRFMYHYFLTSDFQRYLNDITHNATIAHYTISQVKETEVPVPPIDVQKRVVYILDNFESICSDMCIGLPAEINARQKQYVYYRDKLLSFKEHKG